MFKNYLTIAFRNLRRHKGYAFLNVAGLAVGMTCCVLIALFVRDELRYDRFHENGDRIARLVRPASAMSGAPMGPALVRDLPEVEQFTRLTGEGGLVIERADGESFIESVYFADPAFFGIFSFTFMHGNPATALDRPDALVISESAARKYFGDANPLGQPLTSRYGSDTELTFTVTGVVEDVPQTSHFRFDLMAPFDVIAQQNNRLENWNTNWLFTYVLLDESADVAQVDARLPEFFEAHTGEAWTHFSLQPLHRIHLHSAHLEYDIAPQGNITYVLLFAAVAVLILLIACVNFINLTTARSVRRAQEVGMRKALGAQRGQLIRQFLGESTLLAVLAVVLASQLVTLLLPAFRSLTGQALVLSGADTGFLVLCFAGLALLVGGVAGSYPALVLASYRPIQALKGGPRTPSTGGGLRKTLVVFQFSVSSFLIAATLVVLLQLDYLQNARLGFEKDQVVILDFGPALSERSEEVKREFLQHPNVLGVAAADNVPGEGVSDFFYRPDGLMEEDLPSFDSYFVDPDYVDLLDMNIIQGRNFSVDLASDQSGFLLNETALNRIVADQGEAWTNPIGRQLDFYIPGAEGWEVYKSGPVIGVVQDFHYRSLHAEIGPLVMQVLPQAFDYLLVKVRTDDLSNTLDFLETQWTSWGPDTPFAYTFLDDTFDQLYRSEERLATIFGWFAGLAILIACLGLFGLAAFSAQQRTKELGIRKVLGASTAHLVGLFASDFLHLVALAFVLSLPLAYIALSRWLDGFAYAVELGPGVFVVAALVTLVIALATVSYQSIKAARANPVDSLRYE